MRRRPAVIREVEARADAETTDQGLEVVLGDGDADFSDEVVADHLTLGHLCLRFNEELVGELEVPAVFGRLAFRADGLLYVASRQPKIHQKPESTHSKTQGHSVFLNAHAELCGAFGFRLDARQGFGGPRA